MDILPKVTVVLVFVFTLPIVSAAVPGNGDYVIEPPLSSASPIEHLFSDFGFYFTTGESCEEKEFTKGTTVTWLICDHESGGVVYSHTSIIRMTPTMYNDTILLVNGEQGRPDFGEKNEIFGIDIERGQKVFTVNSPWNDGGTIKQAIVSNDGKFVSFVRYGCTQIWNMETMSNEILFAEFEGSSNRYCTNVRSDVDAHAFSPDGSVYVGYEPRGGLAAYSTSDWSKLGMIQDATSESLTATKFIFLDDYAFYIEKGGWEVWPSSGQYSKSTRMVNKLFKIDISEISNLWNQEFHSEVFFGPNETSNIDGKLIGFSNHQPERSLWCARSQSTDWEAEDTHNRIQIMNVIAVNNFDSILVNIVPTEHQCSISYRDSGWILVSDNGTILSELTSDSQYHCSDPTICNLIVKFKDSDDDGTPDYLDGAPYDPRDTVDSDGDNVGDKADPFPNDSTQYEDKDLDGYGDNKYGNNPDLFPDDATQWFDSDGDGYGDNINGNDPDLFPDDSSQWNDTDGDGYGDNPWGNRIDFFPTDALRWADSDRDGVSDEEDDCPNQSDGIYDQDGDGDCEGQDIDDDGDGFTDYMEESCGTQLNNSSSFPPDLDGDFICDDYDADLDGDNVTNEADIFPLDGTEWNDLDQDGIGNNSDDCVGTYGTSTVDRLGCLDQDGDGVSDLNDLDPYDAKIGLDEYSTDQTDMASESGGVLLFSALGVFIIAGIIIFVRSRRSNSDVDEEEFEEADKFDRNVTTTPVTSSDEPSSQNIPDFSLSGSQHESGYEVLEYPEGSEQWWWKDTENQCWAIWE